MFGVLAGGPVHASLRGCVIARKGCRPLDAPMHAATTGGGHIIHDCRGRGRAGDILFLSAWPVSLLASRCSFSFSCSLPTFLCTPCPTQAHREPVPRSRPTRCHRPPCAACFACLHTVPRLIWLQRLQAVPARRPPSGERIEAEAPPPPASEQGSWAGICVDCLLRCAHRAASPWLLVSKNVATRGDP